jgi:hypothetical protein
MTLKAIVTELLARGCTLQEISDGCGFASAGHVHGLLTGRQRSALAERALALDAMLRRVRRRKRRV